MFALLDRLFRGPAWLTFLVMGMAAGGFALCSFNLLFLFQANYNLLFAYDAMAAFDGGLLQFIELTAWLSALARAAQRRQAIERLGVEDQRIAAPAVVFGGPGGLPVIAL